MFQTGLVVGNISNSAALGAAGRARARRGRDPAGHHVSLGWSQRRTSFERGLMFHVDSEVGRLRQVILHRPDLELKRLTPDNMPVLLFADMLWVTRAQAEHDAFAEVLRSRGVVVHYYGDLLAQTLDILEARGYVLDRLFDP